MADYTNYTKQEMQAYAIAKSIKENQIVIRCFIQINGFCTHANHHQMMVIIPRTGSHLCSNSEFFISLKKLLILT